MESEFSLKRPLFRHGEWVSASEVDTAPVVVVRILNDKMTLLMYRSSPSLQHSHNYLDHDELELVTEKTL